MPFKDRVFSLRPSKRRDAGAAKPQTFPGLGYGKRPCDVAAVSRGFSRPHRSPQCESSQRIRIPPERIFTEDARPLSRAYKFWRSNVPTCNARCADSVADLLPKHGATAAHPPRKPHAAVTQVVSRKNPSLSHLCTIHLPVCLLTVRQFAMISLSARKCRHYAAHSEQLKKRICLMTPTPPRGGHATA